MLCFDNCALAWHLLCSVLAQNGQGQGAQADHHALQIFCDSPLSEGTLPWSICIICTGKEAPAFTLEVPLRRAS